MSSENWVHPALLTYGTAGTTTAVAASSTNTSNPYAMPRADYTVQLTQQSTGTSIAAATVIWQGSNDNVTFVPIGSATTLPSTNAAGAGTSTYATAGFAVTGSRYAYGRAIVGSTGTGNAFAWLGS